MAVDAIVFGDHHRQLYLLLIKQKYGPYQGQWALPGGFVGNDEPLREAVVRELREEAGTTAEIVGGSVAATEHSVMSMGTNSREEATFRRLIQEVYPTGNVSIVSDTWDLWRVLTEYLPNLRREVLARNGKVVIRPDSDDPVDILCGNPSGATRAERKGAIELLWVCDESNLWRSSRPGPYGKCSGMGGCSSINRWRRLENGLL